LETLGGNAGREHDLAVSMMKKRGTQIDVRVGNFLDSM
jgi:hypothetical protein